MLISLYVGYNIFVRSLMGLRIGYILEYSPSNVQIPQMNTNLFLFEVIMAWVNAIKD